MTKQKKLTLLNWGVAGTLMLLFLIWHGAFEGPVTSAEVDLYVERYQEQHPKEDTSNLRSFFKRR